MCDYMAQEAALHGTPWPSIARHMLGLRHGLPGSRRWRQVWSDHKLKHLPPHAVMALAHLPVGGHNAEVPNVAGATSELMHNSLPAVALA